MKNEIFEKTIDYLNQFSDKSTEIQWGGCGKNQSINIVLLNDLAERSIILNNDGTWEFDLGLMKKYPNEHFDYYADYDYLIEKLQELKTNEKEYAEAIANIQEQINRYETKNEN